MYPGGLDERGAWRTVSVCVCVCEWVCDLLLIDLVLRRDSLSLPY